jgi:Protein of unknown function (DUF4232)
MTRYGHVAWRVIAVVAFAGTAALAVTLTHVPRPAAVSLDSAGSTCAPSGLQAWLGLGNAGTVPGSAARSAGASYTLEFTNVSARSCSLYGYPAVSAYAGSQVSGTQIGSAATRDTAIRPQPVVLAPGATAHAVLSVTGTSNFQPTACAQVTAPELRVMLPDQVQAMLVPIRLAACSKKGPEFMSVQAIQPKPGIPGSSLS